jgi:hypothetical protein
VLGCEIRVTDIVAQDVVGSREHGRSDSDDPLLRSAASALPMLRRPSRSRAIRVFPEI